MPFAPEIPPKTTPENDAGYLEELTKAIFRAGFSWRVISDKWDNFRQAFHGFDPATVAGYTPIDLQRLSEDRGIVRNRRKLEATVENARHMLEILNSHGTFQSYLRSLDHLDYYQRVKTLTQRFDHLGRTGAFVFLHCVNEEHPPWDQR